MCIRDSWYTHRTALNGAHYKQFFSWAKQELYEDGNWQNDVFPPQFSFQMYDRIGECVPHVDSSNYAGLVPLNTEEELKESFSGTGFYKYNKTAVSCPKGFFCPRGLRCMVPCNSGAFCPGYELVQNSTVCKRHESHTKPPRTIGGVIMCPGDEQQELCQEGFYSTSYKR